MIIVLLLRAILGWIGAYIAYKSFDFECPEQAGDYTMLFMFTIIGTFGGGLALFIRGGIYICEYLKYHKKNK